MEAKVRRRLINDKRELPSEWRYYPILSLTCWDCSFKDIKHTALVEIKNSVITNKWRGVRGAIDVVNSFVVFCLPQSRSASIAMLMNQLDYEPIDDTPGRRGAFAMIFAFFIASCFGFLVGIVAYYIASLLISGHRSDNAGVYLSLAGIPIAGIAVAIMRARKGARHVGIGHALLFGFLGPISIVVLLLAIALVITVWRAF